MCTCTHTHTHILKTHSLCPQCNAFQCSELLLPSSPSMGDDESRNHSEGKRLEKTNLCDLYTSVTDFRRLEIYTVSLVTVPFPQRAKSRFPLILSALRRTPLSAASKREIRGFFPPRFSMIGHNLPALRADWLRVVLAGFSLKAGKLLGRVSHSVWGRKTERSKFRLTPRQPNTEAGEGNLIFNGGKALNNTKPDDLIPYR